MSSNVSKRSARSGNAVEQKARTGLLKKRTLLTYDELPEWYKDNQFIRQFYRPVSYSTSACFGSWFYIHNETFNIYTHLIPALGFLLAQATIYSRLQARFDNAHPGDYTIFAVFLGAAFATLCLSVTYHTMMSHSMRVSHLWLRMDFLGICCLTLGAFVSGIYVGFYCRPKLQKIYWVMVSPFSRTDQISK